MMLETFILSPVGLYSSLSALGYFLFFHLILLSFVPNNNYVIILWACVMYQALALLSIMCNIWFNSHQHARKDYSSFYTKKLTLCKFSGLPKFTMKMALWRFRPSFSDSHCVLNHCTYWQTQVNRICKETISLSGTQFYPPSLLTKFSWHFKMSEPIIC